MMSELSKERSEFLMSVGAAAYKLNAEGGRLFDWSCLVGVQIS